jgi:hypothetical protein
MRELTRHITGSNDYWLLQGPFCKTVLLSSSSCLGGQEQQEGGRRRRRPWWLQSPAPRPPKSSTVLGNRERRSWGTSRSAHRGGRRTGAAEFHRGAVGGWLWSMMPAAAFRVASGEVKMLHRSSLSSRTPWRPQLPPVGSLAGGWRTAGGGASRLRRTAWLGGGVGHGELGHAGASAGAAI